MNSWTSVLLLISTPIILACAIYGGEMQKHQAQQTKTLQAMVDTQEQQTKTLQAMVDTQEQQIKTLQAMVTRDDKIIKSLMGPEGWDRSKPVYGRSYTISNDSIVWAFTQEPEQDTYYELSF